ncbi:MAG: hypothetical protein IKX85_05765 [Clostridia bacterium]|nr:hypothetical protein [Clostridia bacterium]
MCRKRAALVVRPDAAAHVFGRLSRKSGEDARHIAAGVGMAGRRRPEGAEG